MIAILGEIALSELGRLERVALREVWLGEATHFTPWLAMDQNLEVLSETLGLSLEVEATETFVGPFRADILCKDIFSDTFVLIENQLEKTDHNHLGQLLTYASGLEAVTIVWIASKFTQEHRSTLDWLNRITDDQFRFFGLEVELWRIGESPPAPKFNIVSQPNDWSKAVSKAAHALDEKELSETKVLQREYWDGLHDQLEKVSGPISGKRTAQAQNWMNYPVGRTGFTLGTAMHLWDRWIRVELYISGENAKTYFDQLMQEREAIDAEIGDPLNWDRMDDLPNDTRKDVRISLYLKDADPGVRVEWTSQHTWLANKLNLFHSVFAPRVRDLVP
ncbi:DUF4268 domain-containing protein [Alteriqipengyuania sp.]|uniref:DUF4268 domain-containing protein n=1 Tax=Alteriqipengyuania sp. TaxID=2800692 RepID=UPI003515BDCB